jgi:NADPH:quinone reductase-like Zn-dependent oxidoreductase
MSTKQSPNIAAVLEAAHAQMTISTLPIPQPGPNEVLVRNHAVAANGADWKIQAYGIFVEKVCLEIYCAHPRRAPHIRTLP